MYTMRYGDSKLTFRLPEGEIKETLLPRELEGAGSTPEELVERALAAPIGAPPLEQVVHAGETVCIIIPDITRVWQQVSLYLPVLVRRLNEIGIPDRDIRLLSATGAHRRQTPEEHLALIGEDLFRRFKVIDHQSDEKESLTYVGTTSRGTPVWLNSLALDADKLILTGGVTCHSMAGFSGGRKIIVPGIAGKETIDANHSLVLRPDGGVYPGVRCGCMDETNPMHEDLVESAAFAKPDYLLNVVVDGNHSLAGAYAGDWIAAHREAAKFVSWMDGAEVRGRCDLVIASTGGLPKDVNLYQASRTIANAVQMLSPNGTVIMLAKCSEGIGDEDCARQIEGFGSMAERKADLREKFTVGKYVGYQFADIAERFTFILVSDIPEEAFRRTKIHAVSSMEEALLLADANGYDPKRSIALMPDGSKTMPIFENISR